MCSSVSKMYSGMYLCPDNIKNLKISVKLKKLQSIAHSGSDIDVKDSEKESKTFTWLQKVFSRTEVDYFSKESNCYSEQEKQYHEMITNSETESGRIFSYIPGDIHEFLNKPATTEVQSKQSYLQKQMDINTKNKIKDTSNSVYEINKFLNNSISDPYVQNCYETMYIMADLGDSEPNSNIWLKSEHVLCTIKYDENNKLLWIFPDFSSNENDIYKLEINIGGKLCYGYSIENVSEIKNSEIIQEENEIIKKINKRKLEMNTYDLNLDFSIPLKNSIRFYIFCEILTAKEFEYDNLYVQYNVDLPDNWSNADPNSLYGTTQICRTKGPENIANFGYYFDLCLETKIEEDSEGLLKHPVIYFQVISRDFWNRYRTEGLGYQIIPISNPGTHEFTLQCIRICPSDSIGNLRRFFIGDYFSVDDITWIGLPKQHEGSTLNKFGIPTIGTGILSIRINIISQINKSNNEIGVLSTERLHTSALVKTVGEVISAFRKARENMLKARKNIKLEE